MRKLVASLVFSSFVLAPAFASPIPIKPGLWNIQMKMKSDGKETDPQAKLNEAMAKLPADQRKMMAEMMKKQGIAAGTSGKGFDVCYTKEMLDDASSLSRDPEGKCETSITSQSNEKILMDFKCKDGVTGKGEWKLDGKDKYKGHVAMTQKDGKQTELDQEGKFLKADCGDVKPLKLPKSAPAKH